MFTHVGQGFTTEDIICSLTSQEFQEINSILTRGGFKPGEPFIPNVGAIAIHSLMAGSRIIGVDITRSRQPDPQNVLLFQMVQLFV